MVVFEGWSLPRKSEKSGEVGGNPDNSLGIPGRKRRFLEKSYCSLGKNDNFPIFLKLFLPIFPTFLGDFNLQKLPSRGLWTLWEWKNRVLLEEYYIFNVAIPLEAINIVAINIVSPQ